MTPFDLREHDVTVTEIHRNLRIGDDEHVWSNDGIFNLEGGWP
jgi:ATP-dependent phosphoenolpyruvate carboxykinase